MNILQLACNKPTNIVDNRMSCTELFIIENAFYETLKPNFVFDWDLPFQAAITNAVLTRLDF